MGRLHGRFIHGLALPRLDLGPQEARLVLDASVRDHLIVQAHVDVSCDTTQILVMASCHLTFDHQTIVELANARSILARSLL